MKFLDRFKTAAKPAQQEGDTEMSQNTEVASLATDEKVVELSNALAAKEALMTEMQSKFEALEAQLASLETEKASLAEKAKAVVQAARKEKLEAVLGTVGAAPVLMSMEGADEATFETVLNAFSANRKAESESEMFNEQGVSAEVLAIEEDPVKSLAEKFAAQFKN